MPAKLTHIVWQKDPEGNQTPAKFWDATDESVRDWLRTMRRDNPDHTYTPVQV